LDCGPSVFERLDELCGYWVRVHVITLTPWPYVVNRFLKKLLPTFSTPGGYPHQVCFSVSSP
jgi:hypothetical protein